ncbi:hypothetical protein [Nocardia jiangxiensis]|uniref:hypothetical protein n=1 Tax=Nocardia jiangxiensis TaxID=282685 RepID=UPI0002E5BD14|nr:hypothetical protein [Nocardia jiangxiensis]
MILNEHVEQVILSALNLVAARMIEDLNPGNPGVTPSRELHYKLLVDDIKDAAKHLD